MTSNAGCRRGYARNSLVPHQQPRLSPAAAKAFDDASAAGDSILIPSISLLELTYLVEKGRVPAEARKRLVDALAQPGGPYELAPLDGRVAAAVELIDRSVVPDMPDRIIAATSLSACRNTPPVCGI